MAGTPHKPPSGRTRERYSLSAAVRKTRSFLGASVAIGLGVLIVLLLYMRSQALPATAVPQTSMIYDVNGKLIDSFHTGENRTIVPLADMSAHLIWATLAIEDHRFYEHWGIDFRRLARAVTVNLKTMSKEQGTSTLTQQLARNLYLNHERTWTRKIKEAFYAVQLELKLSKDEILESYLNEIYYGHSAYGAEAAAQMYFGKRAKDLTLAESALLAGIPKGPAYYSPYLNMENAKARQELILDKMAEFGYITAAEAEAAKRERLEIKPKTQEKPAKAPYFRDFVKQQAQEKLGLTEAEFEEGGFRIYTTLDLTAQEAAEDLIARHLADKPDMQAALVALDPRSGEIRAMVGGRDYAANQYNRVTAATRQPGSAFKPIVYLAALEQPGFTPVTRFRSEPTTFAYDNGRQTYAPSNFNNHYEYDWIDLREAIAKSDNIYAVSTIRQIGEDRAVEMARRLGTTAPLNPVPSLALGTSPVSLLEMASAFGTIANLGVRVEPTAILRIETSGGRVVYEAEPKAEAVVAPEYAYVLTHAMQSVFEPGGTGYRVASILKRPVAAKTGTTNTDAWMVGFTPELATAVWVGYDRNRNISNVESYKAVPIFAEFTGRALEAIPPKTFRIPENVVTVYIDPTTGKLATEGCPVSRLEAFVKGAEPTEPCSEHGESKPKKGGKPEKNKRGRSWWDDLKRWWND